MSKSELKIAAKESNDKEYLPQCAPSMGRGRVRATEDTAENRRSLLKALRYLADRSVVR